MRFSVSLHHETMLNACTGWASAWEVRAMRRADSSILNFSEIQPTPLRIHYTTVTKPLPKRH